MYPNNAICITNLLLILYAFFWYSTRTQSQKLELQCPACRVNFLRGWSEMLPIADYLLAPVADIVGLYF